MSAKFQEAGEKDLFEQAHAADKKIKERTRLLLPDIKQSVSLSYENIVFLMITFVMSCIIFFSLGVEKGRRERAISNDTAIEYTEDSKKDIVRSAGVHQPAGSYIIQVAAFKKIESAEEARANLKKEGYASDIKKSNDYYQIYIGGVETEEAARKMLKQVRQKYSDSYYIKKK